MDGPYPNERCQDMRSPKLQLLILSIIIVVGLLISYLPQHYRIIARRTSEGISPYFVLLGVTSATSGFANIVTLPQSQQDIACCKVVGKFECAIGLLGIAQLGVQWFCFAFILVLFLVFFRIDDANVPESELSREQPKWQTALMVAWICLLHAVVVFVVSVTVAIAVPGQLGYWANLLGLMAAGLAAVQYLPQIWTTYRLRHVGSLSIPMLLIQTPGGLLFAGSLYSRLGPDGWSSWGVYLLTAVMQGSLLSMAIYFELQPRSPQDFEQLVSREESQAAAETQPLLRPGGIGDPHRNEPRD